MSDGNGHDAIWTTQGIKVLGKTLTRVEMRARQIEWYRQFADFATFHQVHIVCDKCGSALTGRNADSDPVFAVACGCREWIGANRDYNPGVLQ
jgi:hypothetical protein